MSSLVAVASSKSKKKRSLVGGVDRLILHAERFAASRTRVFLAFTALYLIPTVLLCRIKLLWDDEFFTLYLSRTADWKTLIQALATGADQHPPSFYYLTHCILSLFGTSHVTVRLTAIFGFWLLCVCLYQIMRPLTSPIWAVVAMLLPLTMHVFYYATEARAYGLLTGFAALATLSWLRASANHRRRLYLALLALSLAAAVASHYYAGMMVLCLALGELVRTVSRRKVDWSIWIAFSFSLLPILLFFQTIQRAKGYSTHFWAVPVWSDAITFYTSQLGSGPAALLGILAVAVCFRISLRTDRSLTSSGIHKQPPLNLWQATAICSLSALPFIVMVIAKFVTHGFTDRYAISAIIGLTILLSYLLYRVMPQPRVAVVAAITCIAMFGFQVHNLATGFEEGRDFLATDIGVLSTVGNQQVACLGITSFHQLSFYTPREVASRLTFVADPDAAIKYLGQDTVDRGLLELDPWFPLKVIPVQSFLEHNPHFLSYGRSNVWSWLTYDLSRWGETRLLGRAEHENMLFEVTGVHPTPEPTSLAPQHWDESRMLYWKMPQTGPSLCDRYMGAQNCPHILPGDTRPSQPNRQGPPNRPLR